MNSEAKEYLKIISEAQGKFHILMSQNRRLTGQQFKAACDLLCVVAVAGRGLVVHSGISQMPEMVRKMISNMTADLEQHR